MHSDALVILSALVLIGLVPVNLLATYLLYSVSRENVASRANRALSERKRVSLLLTTASVLCASIGAYRILSIAGDSSVNIQPYPMIIVTAVSIIISLPGLLWVTGYFSDWFSG
jgi:hypothetical protein